jgi:GT2 family glycosyltransferase
MIRRTVFEEIGGLDEALAIDFNDVDLCLRLLQKGYYNTFTPHALLYHFEGRTRVEYYSYMDTHNFLTKWSAFLGESDPFYNPNLSQRSSNIMALKASDE